MVADAPAKQTLPCRWTPSSRLTRHSPWHKERHEPGEQAWQRPRRPASPSRRQGNQARAELSRARDSLVPLGAPAIDDSDLAAASETLTGWAQAQHAQRSQHQSALDVAADSLAQQVAGHERALREQVLRLVRDLAPDQIRTGAPCCLPGLWPLQARANPDAGSKPRTSARHQAAAAIRHDDRTTMRTAPRGTRRALPEWWWLGYGCAGDRCRRTCGTA